MKSVGAVLKSFGLVTISAAALLSSPFAYGADGAKIEKAVSVRDGEVFGTDLQVKGDVTATEVQAQFFNETVQVDIADMSLAKAKLLSRVNDRLVKSIYVSQPDSESVRIRYFLKTGFLAKSLEDQLRIQKSPGHISIQILGEAKRGVAVKGEAEITRVVAVSEGELNSDEGGGALNAKLVVDGETLGKRIESGSQDGASIEAKTGAAAAADAKASGGAPGIGAAANPEAISLKKEALNKLPESQIPVLAETKTDKKETTSAWPRLMMTLGVLVVLLGATSFGVKRWAARTQGRNQNTKIRVLTTHHLGPKKTLAIVQVAGESLLIGITDHNISMLKTLALIDDEVPETVPRRFDQSLAAEFDDDDTDETGGMFAMRGISEIRDVFSRKNR